MRNNNWNIFIHKAAIKSKVILYFLIISISFVIIGCGDLNDGCGGSCRGGFFCPTSREECKCVSERKDCNKFSFNEKTGKCKISGCSVCSLLIGRCSESSSAQNDSKLSEYLSVFPLENGCDIFSGEYSEFECEAIAYYRQCESMDIIPLEEDRLVNECWFYECQECSLNLPLFGNQIME